MKLNSKVTWGLAWAGLAVIVAVPSADFLTGKMGTTGNKALLTSTTEPVTTPAVVPTTLPTAPMLTPAPAKVASVVTSTRTATGVTITPAGSPLPTSSDPVNQYISKNKTLPDYISDGPATAATKPAVTAPTEVATVEPPPVVVAPIPFPSWARPRDVVKPAPAAVPAQPPVIVDENALATGQGDANPDVAALDTAGPVPPAGVDDDNAKSWQRKGLTQYLDQQGLLNDPSADGRSSASVTVVKRPSPTYDPDGFYLSDGPNSDRAARRAARLRAMFGDDYVDDGSDQPPDQLNVF